MKNKRSNYLFFTSFLFALFFVPNLNAQKVDIDLEKIREKCEDSPYEERVKVTVARFDVKTSHHNYKSHREFGDELTSMLTNTLQKVNCFRVLKSLKKMSDMTDELNMGESKYFDSESAPEIGKMLGAQAIFTGEITEFYAGEGRKSGFGISLSSNKARIGFIIQLVNPETREIIWSDSYEAEAKVPGGFSGAKIFGVNIIGGNKPNTALGDAVERGIIKAIYGLTKKMEEGGIRFPDVPDIDEANTVVTTLKISNVSSYSQLSSLTKFLKENDKIRIVKRESFDKPHNRATLKVRHKEDIDMILDFLDTKGSGKVEIVDFSGEVVQLAMR